MKKLFISALLAASTLLPTAALANWYNIDKVQYLMQNLDDRDSIIYTYANSDLQDIIDTSNSYDDGACTAWEIVGGVDFDSQTVANTSEFSITADGAVRVDFYSFEDADPSAFYVYFDDNGSISEIYDEYGTSFSDSTLECIAQ